MANKIKFSALNTIDTVDLDFSSAIVPLVQDGENFKVLIDSLEHPRSQSVYTTVQTKSGDWDAHGVVQGTGITLYNLEAYKQQSVEQGGFRGEGSVDLQTSRSTAVQVASGANSVVGGGRNNQAAGTRDTVGGGFDNATLDPMGFNNVITGGGSNKIDDIGYPNSIGYANSIGGGTNNTITGHTNTIPGGSNNTVNSNYSFATGLNANAVHDGATVFSDSTGGEFSSVKANSFNIKAEGGLRLVDGTEGEGKILTCYNDGEGHWADAPEGGVSLSVTTQNDTQAELLTVSDSSRISVSLNETVMFSVLVVARSTSGLSAGYTIEGVIKDVNGITSIVGIAIKTVFAEENANWDATVTADNNSITLLVNGAPSEDVKWNATVNKVVVV